MIRGMILYFGTLKSFCHGLCGCFDRKRFCIIMKSYKMRIRNYAIIGIFGFGVGWAHTKKYTEEEC